MRSLRVHLTFVATLIQALVFVEQSTAQLAITEVMASAIENTNTIPHFRGTDYWELTNFGTNSISLQDYGFRDSEPRQLMKDPFNNLVIQPGESVIFFWLDEPGQSVTSAAGFKTWWGESNLPAALQCVAYSSPGFSGWDGDAVWLYDASSNVVDCVQFSRGRAYTYEADTGFFGVRSAAGHNGAFVAALADDVGSPGTTTGPVSVRVLQQPVDQSAGAGMTVRFGVIAAGLPRPRYQWFVHGTPTPVGTNATLILTKVQLTDAGAYHVVISNGLTVVTSAVATLTVSTNPTAPTIAFPPADLTVFEGQTAIFRVGARGLPPPNYQWQKDGMDVAGATEATFEIIDISSAFSGARYTVQVSNSMGSTSASARLTVTRRPDLRITEVMAVPANEAENRHFDWFELTNYDTNSVNLMGWRFSDEFSFGETVTITNALTLAPGESAIFAERLDARLFAAWWGSNNLPQRLKVFSYTGVGLRSSGDELFVWNAAATDVSDHVTTASWAGSTPGVSLEFEHHCDAEGFCQEIEPRESILGLRGCFRAVDGSDIGSPGYVSNPPLRILFVDRTVVDEVSIGCRVTVGGTYRLHRSPSLSPPSWTAVEQKVATNNVLSFTTSLAEDESASFYRVEQVP